MAVSSYPFLLWFLQVPKLIVNHINDAVDKKGEAFQVDVSLFGNSLFEMESIAYLLLLCVAFLCLVLVNQGFKYVINVYRGLTGERMLRRLRYDLYGRVLRFPQSTFRKLSQGEIIQMINAEVEPLGGFFGEAFSLPLFQGGYLLVIFGFILSESLVLAGAAVMFYPIQFYLIPKLQRRVNLLGKTRVRLVRSLSDRIGETVSGVQEIHAHNTARYELAEFARRLGEIFDTRYRIYLWKFVIKFINNTVNHLGPFFFYSVGGILVIQGELNLGALVAVLAANKDLAAPWKELLNYYQRREDARIKYEQVVEQFEPPEMMDEAQQLDEPAAIEPMSGAYSASAVRLEDDTGHALIDSASFEIGTGDRVAIVGAGGSGKDQFGLLLARLVKPTGGSLTINGAKLDDLPEAVTGRRIGYVGPSAYIFATTVRENLTYGLKHQPLGTAGRSDADEETWEDFLSEARRAGNSTDDPAADWVDYAAAGIEGKDDLSDQALDVLRMVDMQSDIYELGLRGSIDPAAQPLLARDILKARASFRERLAGDPGFAPLVEVFDPDRYNDNATVGENLLFGRPVGGAFDLERLAEHSYVLEVLEKAELTDKMLEAGRQVASTMVELFADLPPGHEFFERYAFISHEDLPGYQALLSRLGREGVEALRDDERTSLLSLPFRLSPAQHRLDVVDDAFKQQILAARRIFADNLPDDLKDAVEHFDEDAYTAAASLQDNILFGKAAYGHARGVERIGAVIAEVIDALDLRPAVMTVGLDFNVGIGGGRLSSVQRQKLGLARVVLKRPDVLIINEATATIDSASQGRILENLLDEFEGRGVIWVLHRARLAEYFNRILVVQAGRVVEQGSFNDLNRDGSMLHDLIGAE
ncbi:MAG: ATP-binding cassette domain-containing protein [Rhodospirillaceae bacterium]|nr:ATP-binding cassette domain-containing protein [Rhodospirillaceae bacterium]MBT5455089.1 ATP-binding cassette domain-containing protein [Rhodospirillaceae bacterium]